MFPLRLKDPKSMTSSTGSSAGTFRSTRTVPCLRCRSLHLNCQWGESQEGRVTCIRCTEDDQQCSGPQKRPRSRKGPCDSCKRKRTRCIWTEGDELCARCRDRGLGVCPIPPRSSKYSATPATSAPDLSRRSSDDLKIPQSETWSMVMTDSMRRNLMDQGRLIRRLKRTSSFR
ncbi:hypothetical protein BD324DRAFT_218703 [Kockovaella imperatae]|uniref:Zn(2)-C6 fungal-type domain-containing protein n=1 Tax=Kockovaella imperatae TaxID=4999 RepID=A0A1Y1U7W2_9TREE|nr:hypothetical protein BD324DRAFT_218703 [Kockovaella imperatae]ORX33606.1 hypothetical protein BD324DRAFT_218703 [Kockovaella imperatae]